MKYSNEKAALMQIQMVQMVMVQHCYQTMVTTPTKGGPPVFELTVFFDNKADLRTLIILLLNLTRKDEKFRIQHLKDPEIKGGWIEYNVEF